VKLLPGSHKLGRVGKSRQTARDRVSRGSMVTGLGKDGGVAESGAGRLRAGRDGSGTFGGLVKGSRGNRGAQP
jgi:hypothetical protein